MVQKMERHKTYWVRNSALHNTRYIYTCLTAVVLVVPAHHAWLFLGHVLDELQQNLELEPLLVAHAGTFLKLGLVRLVAITSVGRRARAGKKKRKREKQEEQKQKHKA